MVPSISVIVCTHNRVEYLQKSIQSLANQTLPVHGFEIIVVDNASTDHTRKLIQSEFSHVSNLRYVDEPILGLSRARNTGWKHARAEYVAYLDDDAIAAPNWVETILDTFQQITPQPGIVCGKVIPLWESTQPVDLPESTGHLLSILDWSEEPFVLRGKHFCGANMAFPKAALAAVGGFAVKLGRKGKQLISNEESLLQHQLEQMGYCTYYHPGIQVQHHIPAHRLRVSWLLQRSYWQGISDARLSEELECRPALKKAGLILYAARNLFKQSISLVRSLFSAQDQQKFLGMRCDCYRALGFVVGLTYPA